MHDATMQGSPRKKFNKIRELNRRRNYFTKKVRNALRVGVAKALWDRRRRQPVDLSSAKTVLLMRNEGAVVVSARARHKRDVGRATLLAVLSALAVYLLVTLLSLGVVPRSELAEMRNPSMAGLMVRLMGSWGEIVIAAGLIVSVCGAYLSWTIMAAEVPFLAATHKAFPRLFARQNSNNAPSA